MEFGYFTLSDNHYENNPRDANQFVSIAASRPLDVLFEDVQWGSPDTLALIEDLARRI